MLQPKTAQVGYAFGASAWSASCRGEAGATKGRADLFQPPNLKSSFAKTFFAIFHYQVIFFERSVKHAGMRPPLRTRLNTIEYFPPNFEGLVLGCIDADFCKLIRVGKLSPRSTQCTPLHRSLISFFSSKIAKTFRY